METTYKWVVPVFLRRWDTFLLERYPIVWRTRAHYVLFYASMATLLLFIIGFIYPVSATNLTVHPFSPIVLSEENFFIIPLAVLSLGILFWAYTQFQVGFPSAKPKHVLLTLLIYGVCLYTIIAITAPAFYLGTVFRTAYFFMDEADIKYWEDNDFFLYGFVLKESDSIYVKPDTSFFQEREAAFRKLWVKEENILMHRYDNSFTDTFFSTKVKWYLSKRPYLSNLLGLSDREYRVLEEANTTPTEIDLYNYLYSSSLYWPSKLNLFELSFWPPGLNRHRPSRDRWISWKTYDCYRNYWSYWSKGTIESLDTIPMYLLYMLDYQTYYQQFKLPKTNTSILEKYQIPLHYDSLQIGSFTFTRPGYLLDMEDAIRSKRHARQYLKMGVLWHYLTFLCCLSFIFLLFAAPSEFLKLNTIKYYAPFLLFFQVGVGRPVPIPEYFLSSIIEYYIPLLALLLFAVPYLSLRHALVAVAVAMAVIGTITMLRLENLENIHLISLEGRYLLNAGAYLALPLTGLWLLYQATLQKKGDNYVPLAFHILVIGIAIILFFCLFGEKWVFTTDELFISKPVDLAFFGVQIIGLVGMLFMVYLQKLPKQV
ncbi:MAG: hypothetical protein H6573_32950 [Lewinellaceae bacterium]|nr:hypothetical protein [Lewinellaceae bacterium]